MNLNPSAQKVSIFQNLFSCTIKKHPPNPEQEMTNLQCEDMLKSKYQEQNLTECYKYTANDDSAQKHMLKNWQYLVVSICVKTYFQWWNM